LTTTKSAIKAIKGLSHGAHGQREDRPRKPAWTGQLAWLARWLHTYLSMFSFLMLLFFAVTGLTLNHAEWFASRSRTVQRQGALNLAWVKNSDANAVAKPEIIEYFRRVERVKGDLGDFVVDDMQCYLAFKGPGYEASAVIDRATGKYQLTETRGGFVAVLNDLHKGRDTGKKWSVLIDISAALMAFVSLTGLTLIFFLTKRRTSGLTAIAIGALLGYLIYAFWVP
jgi:hypothetical protein